MRAFVLITTLAALAAGCSPARGPAPVEDRRATRVATPAAKPPAAKAPASGGAPVATADGFYTVKRGDTLYSIALEHGDRKSTRLNSSHLVISYAVFCLKK